MHKTELPGTIYLNGGRYWWRVKLDGENSRRAIPLKAPGAKYATTDRGVAEKIAQQILDRARFTADHVEVKTIGELFRLYMIHCDESYGREKENVRNALKPLLELYAAANPLAFGPRALKAVRHKMIENDLCRNSINQRIGIVKRMFRWATSEQLIPGEVWQALNAVEGLRRGKSDARETEIIRPIAENHVYTILPYATPTVAAMIELQLLTGMRSGELVIMRPCDIDMAGKIWYYAPSEHKTMHHGFKRLVALGPKAQRILKPFLSRKLDAFCFTPGDSLKQFSQRTYGRNNIRRGINERYNTHTYHQAVKLAIQAAEKAGKKAVIFTPHQLRHTAATRIRKEMGLDAARAVLGHRHLAITDDYAEIDQALAATAAKKLG